MDHEVLFGIKLKIFSREVQLVATKLDDGRIIIVTAVDGERPIDVPLRTEHAIGLGLGLLDAVDPQQLAAFAEHMDQGIAQTIAAGLLAPTAARALLANATAGLEAN